MKEYKSSPFALSPRRQSTNYLRSQPWQAAVKISSNHPEFGETVIKRDDFAAIYRNRIWRVLAKITMKRIPNTTVMWILDRESNIYHVTLTYSV